MPMMYKGFKITTSGQGYSWELNEKPFLYFTDCLADIDAWCAQVDRDLIAIDCLEQKYNQYA